MNLSDYDKTALYKKIWSNKIQISFRNWELHECPALPISSEHDWTVKSSIHAHVNRVSPYITILMRIVCLRTYKILTMNRERREDREDHMSPYSPYSPMPPICNEPL